MAKAGELWAKMTDKEKAPYEKASAEDEKRYQKQLEELNKKGYFMMEDGTKSSEHKAKKKRSKKDSKAMTDDEDEKPKKTKKSKD